MYSLDQQTKQYYQHFQPRNMILPCIASYYLPQHDFNIGSDNLPPVLCAPDKVIIHEIHYRFALIQPLKSVEVLAHCAKFFSLLFFLTCKMRVLKVCIPVISGQP